MDILKILSNPNLLSTAGSTKMTAFDPVQSNKIITPGSGYSQYSDKQVKDAKDLAYKIMSTPKVDMSTINSAVADGSLVPVGGKSVIPQIAIDTPDTSYQPDTQTNIQTTQPAPYYNPQYNPQHNPQPAAQYNPQPNTQTTQTKTDDSTDLYNQRKALTYQMLAGKSLNSGVYDRSGFTQYSPEQISSLTAGGDRFYQNEFNDIQGKIDQYEKEKAAESEISPMTLNGVSYNLSKTQLKTLNTLNPQFEQLIKEPLGVVKASESIDSLSQIAKADSAAAQMALIFSFMKSLDPNSTVREGEYANAENTRGVPDTIRNWYNKAKDGTFLTPTQVQNFAQVSLRQAETARQQIRATAADFDTKAGFNGLPSGIFAAQISNRVGDINNFNGTTSGRPADLVSLSSQNPIVDINDWKARIANNESAGAPDITGRRPGQPGYSQYAVRSQAGTQRKDANGNSYIDYAYGKYQFMGDYIPQWSKEALGYSMTPQQLMQNPDAQEKIMDYLGMKSYKKYGNWDDATAVHFSGRPVAGNNSKDAYGTSVPTYLMNMYTDKNAPKSSTIASSQSGGTLSSGLTYTIEY